MSFSEIQDFLEDCHPFDRLPRKVLAGVSEKISSQHAPAGTSILKPGDDSNDLYIIKSGIVEIRSPSGEVYGQLDCGDTFGIRALLGGGKAPYRAKALADTDLLLLPRSEFVRLKTVEPKFDRFFEPLGAQRPRSETVKKQRLEDDKLNLTTLTVGDLMSSPAFTITSDTTAQAAAKLMRDKDISCLPIVDGDDLKGFVTLSDFRDRMLAEGLSPDVAVSRIMTENPILMESDALAFDALLTMMQRKIGHLPVVEDGKVVGILTHTNLVHAQSTSAIYMVSQIRKHRDPEEIAAVVSNLPSLLTNLVDSGASAHKIGQIITGICDAVTLRLIKLAEEKLGPPPVPYVWAACGSQGRQEQTGVSDQDNCLILDDAYDPDAHGEYFEQFAKFVSDGLDVAGYFYCPGDMMATNPKWRQPLSQWRKYFAEWIANPGPMAQMLASVMFDLRAIHGNAELFRTLQKETLEGAASNSIFVVHMLSNALKHTPPLGFFRNFILESGENKNTLNMKLNGVVPIVDIARVYALEAGIKEANTHRRLEAGAKASVLSPEGARDLLAAFEFIAITRLKHQARQINKGQKPDNFMSPKEISQFERNHLKDAFAVVKTIQSALANAHQMSAR